MTDQPLEPTEKVFLPIPAWLAKAMSEPSLGIHGESRQSEDRVLAKVQIPPDLIDSFSHRIPPEYRTEILPDGFALVFEKTLELRGEARLCRFVGIGVTCLARTIVDLSDFDPDEDKEANAADPPAANGPTGIV